MKKTNSKGSVKKIQVASQVNEHQKKMDKIANDKMNAIKKTTEKEVMNLKKTVARLEKEILSMQAEINKKQDKKITLTISRSNIHKQIAEMVPDSRLMKTLLSKSATNA